MKEILTQVLIMGTRAIKVYSDIYIFESENVTESCIQTILHYLPSEQERFDETIFKNALVKKVKLVNGKKSFSTENQNPLKSAVRVGYETDRI